jgi:hypothetical protein
MGLGRSSGVWSWVKGTGAGERARDVHYLHLLDIIFSLYIMESAGEGPAKGGGRAAGSAEDRLAFR